MAISDRIKRGVLAALSVLASATLLPASPAHAEKKFIAIGTGGPSGIYFIAGNANCCVVHKLAKTENLELRCSAPSTSGSLYNPDAIRYFQEKGWIE